MGTESRIERWKRENKEHLRRYQRNYYRDRKRALLEERLKKVEAEMKRTQGARYQVLKIEAKEISLKLDRLRLQARDEKGAA